MIIYRFFLTTMLVLSYNFCEAQMGITSFLSLPQDTRVQALGSYNISIANNINNPSSLDSSINDKILLTYSPYLKQAHYLNLSYFFAVSKSKNQQFGISLQSLDFGKLIETDAVGNQLGFFRVNNYALSFLFSKKINAFSLGINTKLVGANIASYSNMAFLTDVGVYFKHPAHDFTTTILVKNIGGFVKHFVSSSNQEILNPIVLVGGSFKPRYMPMRFSLTLFGIEDLLHQNIKLNKHLSGGVEVLLNKRLQVLFGYNTVFRDKPKQSVFSLSGFSGGFVFQTRKMGFQYSFARFHQNNNNLFSIIF